MKGCARFRLATRAPPRRRGRRATPSRTIRRSSFISARRRRRRARPWRRRTATGTTCARRPTPRTAPTSSSGSRGWPRRRHLPRRRAGRAPPPDETPGEFGATPPAPSLAPPRRPPARRAAAPAGDAEHPGGAAQPEDSGWNRYNITAVASASVAVVLLGTAALFAAKADSDESDVNRLVGTATRTRARRSGIRASRPSTSRRRRTGRDHDRAAKIALAASAVVAAVSITFFILDAKLGATPAVAIAPDGRGVAASGGLQWRF